MASRYEVEVTITSARDLKNVNWRHGPVEPYAVVWVDPKAKCSTRVDKEGDTCPYWAETLVVPLDAPIENSTLHVDVVHANAAEDTKPIVGSARLPLREVIDDVGFGQRAHRKLELKRPSGRPQGKVDIDICVREPRYRAPDPYYAPPYGVPPPGSRDYSSPSPAPYGNAYGAPPPYGSPYGAPPPPGPYQTAPPVGYPYGAPPQAGPYGQPAYSDGGYGQPYKEEKKSKYGMGTGLAVGAVGGLLGGLAIAEGVDYVEDKIADDAAEKVEDDLGYDGDDF